MHKISHHKQSEFPPNRFPCSSNSAFTGMKLLKCKVDYITTCLKTIWLLHIFQRQKAKPVTINLFFRYTCYPSELFPFHHCEHPLFQPIGAITFLTSQQILILPSLSILFPLQRRAFTPPLSSHSKLYLLEKHEFKIPEPLKNIFIHSNALIFLLSKLFLL